MNIRADELVDRLLAVSLNEQVCLLDSCGADGGLLIAGVRPFRAVRLLESESALKTFQELCEVSPSLFFSIAYELGHAVQNVNSRHTLKSTGEPLIFAAAFDGLVIHDYSSGSTFIDGSPDLADLILSANTSFSEMPAAGSVANCTISETEYKGKVEEIRELIRSGETYQTNLTQKLTIELSPGDMPQSVFRRLRRDHPSSHSAFLDRGTDHAVSISPESFFRISDPAPDGEGRLIEASPIKGTRRRTGDPAADAAALAELTHSEKDRAENVMIADLLRNDLGRVCEFGSVRAESLCEVIELPSLYHLVSRISGRLRKDVGIGEVISSLFPCGSITGCPKIRTMEIIDAMEPCPRGLSMGAIGYAFDRSSFPTLSELWVPGGGKGRCFDLSVAIRSMVIKEGIAEFNAGGGIVIDSDPEAEYRESLSKAAAILKALGVPAPV